MAIGYAPGAARAGDPALVSVAESTVSPFTRPSVENSVPAKMNVTPNGFDWSLAVTVSAAGVTVRSPST